MRAPMTQIREKCEHFHGLFGGEALEYFLVIVGGLVPMLFMKNCKKKNTKISQNQLFLGKINYLLSSGMYPQRYSGLWTYTHTPTHAIPAPKPLGASGTPVMH